MIYNENNGMKPTLSKRISKMKLEQYIDLCLIDEYADKSFAHGYSLDLDNLPDHEVENFLDHLMKNDTAVREYVRIKMQEYIDARLPECEAEDRRHAGISLRYRSNGDTYLEYPRGSYAE